MKHYSIDIAVKDNNTIYALEYLHIIHCNTFHYAGVGEIKYKCN